MPNFKICFCVSGDVTQQVEVTDPKMTKSKLQKLLASGKVATTIQEGGKIEFIKDGKILGKVTSVYNQCEYFDWNVTDDN